MSKFTMGSPHKKDLNFFCDVNNGFSMPFSEKETSPADKKKPGAEDRSSEGICGNSGKRTQLMPSVEFRRNDLVRQPNSLRGEINRQTLGTIYQVLKERHMALAKADNDEDDE